MTASLLLQQGQASKRNTAGWGCASEHAACSAWSTYSPWHNHADADPASYAVGAGAAQAHHHGWRCLCFDCTKMTRVMLAHAPLPLQESCEGPTASCLCFVTPDGQRTMRTCLGASAHLTSSSMLPQGWPARAALLHCEGYCLYRWGCGWLRSGCVLLQRQLPACYTAKAATCAGGCHGYVTCRLPRLCL